MEPVTPHDGIMPLGWAAHLLKLEKQAARIANEAKK
jgi:hypothetical protein